MPKHIQSDRKPRDVSRKNIEESSVIESLFNKNRYRSEIFEEIFEFYSGLNKLRWVDPCIDDMETAYLNMHSKYDDDMLTFIEKLDTLLLLGNYEFLSNHGLKKKIFFQVLSDYYSESCKNEFDPSRTEFLSRIIDHQDYNGLTSHKIEVSKPYNAKNKKQRWKKHLESKS